MQVKIIYRNYKPLHDIYTSLEILPPDEVTFIIPPPKRYLGRFLPFHRKYGSNFFVELLTKKAQKILFDMRQQDNADLYHFVQIVPEKLPSKPYVVDFEHVVNLANFANINESVTDKIFQFLSNHNCKFIMPLSKAANHSLEYLLGDDRYKEIMHKVRVVYPALPNYANLYKGKADYKYVSSDTSTLKLLFVGKGVYRKGLHELLEAFNILQEKYSNIELYVISDAPKSLTREYSSPRIKYFSPVFSKETIITQFYLPCDLYVMPTHSDSFGMVFLYSLSCGLPVVTTKQFATPEIIEPEYNGCFVHSTKLHSDQILLPSRKIRKLTAEDSSKEKILVEDLVSKISCFYNNRQKLIVMGRNAVKAFESGGKFSVTSRNELLSTIYKHSVND